MLIVDCLTLWLSNCMLARGAATAAHCPDSGDLDAQREALLEILPTLPGRVLLVSNELGLGLVPETPLGRLFRDEAGRLNQRVASMADRVSLVVAGLALEIKGG